jgi:hypothetical protein
MAQEAVEIITWLAAFKGLLITVFGFLLKVLWFWKNRPSWPRILAAFLFCGFIFHVVNTYSPSEYQGPLWFVSGMLASNIINTIFELANINEEGIKTYFVNWWKNK